MKDGNKGWIHALEFECHSPLRFYEHCSACPRFGDSCDDLMLGKEILRGKKKLVYNEKDHDSDTIHAISFNCTAPLHYFEKSRKTCGHKGRCREEGLLLALLSGKKEITYAQKTAIEFPYLKKRRKREKTIEAEPKVYIVK